MKTFLFDIDGTLLDTREFIIQATEYALKKYNYPPQDRTYISSLVGSHFDEFYYKLTAERKNIKQLQEAHREFQFNNMDLTTLFSDTINVLEELKNRGYILAVVTSRSKKTSLLSLKHAGILDFFKVIISDEDASALKPSPEPILIALKKLNSLASSTIMIGDSYLDVEAGLAAKTKTIRVLTGFHYNKLNEPKPDHIVNNLKEILNIDWS